MFSKDEEGVINTKELHQLTKIWCFIGLTKLGTALGNVNEDEAKKILAMISQHSSYRKIRRVQYDEETKVLLKNRTFIWKRHGRLRLAE